MDYFSDNCIIVVQSGVAFEAHFKKVIAACSVIIVLGGSNKIDIFSLNNSLYS